MGRKFTYPVHPSRSGAGGGVVHPGMRACDGAVDRVKIEDGECGC